MILLVYFLGLAACLLNVGNGQFDAFIHPDPETLTNENAVLEKWKTLENRVKNMSEELINRIYPFLMDMMGSLNISRSCFRESTKLFLGLRKLNTWAVKFIDATTKSFDGILSMQMPSLGSYDECVNNKVVFRRPGKMKGKVMFQGSYCTVNVRPYLKTDKQAGLLGSSNTGINDNNYPEESVFSEIASLFGYTYFQPIKTGLCVPSGCSTDDVNLILRQVSDYIGISVKAARCATKQENKYTSVVIVVMAAYSLAGFFMLLGTVIDIYDIYFHLSKENSKNVGVQILKAFSFISNYKKLTNTSNSLKTDCLNGLRFLSLSWVIMGHSAMIISSTNHSFPRNFQEYTKEFAIQAVFNGTPSVTTFFFISGFLVSYVVTKLVKIEKNTFNLAVYMLHRLWRILPAYAFVIGYEFIKPLTGSGPLFHEKFAVYTEYCEKNWWTNLLFINNFYARNEMCLPHSWFIAVDMQLYLLAPIVFLPLIRWPKIGIFLAGTIIIVCTAVAVVRSYVYNTMTTFVLSLSKEGLKFFHHDNNLNPYLHAPAYCIGMLLGCLLATRKDFKVPKVLQVIGWSVSATMCLAVVYGVRNWNSGVAPTLWENTMYGGFWRLAWALGVAWMTFCCCTGYGGVINYILSWKIWAPLSRLTYFAYLVHLAVVMSYTANMRSVTRLEYYIAVWMFLGHLVVTYAVAFAGSMLIEAPFLSLEKILLVSRLKEEELRSPKGLDGKVKDVAEKVEAEDNTRMNNILIDKNGSFTETRDHKHVTDVVNNKYGI